MQARLRGVPGWGEAAALHNDLPKREQQQRLLDFRGWAGSRSLVAVDILNEGVDVPDVNILVFARVTHSRRIVEQLGRGLRLREGKTKVIALEFALGTSGA